MPNGDWSPTEAGMPGPEPTFEPSPLPGTFTTRRALTPDELWTGLNGGAIGVLPTPTTVAPTLTGPGVGLPTGDTWAAATARGIEFGVSPWLVQGGATGLTGDLGVTSAQINAVVAGTPLAATVFSQPNFAIFAGDATVADKPWTPQNLRDLETLILLFVLLFGGGQLTGGTAEDIVRRFIALIDSLWVQYVAFMGAGGALSKMSFWDFVWMRLFGTGGTTVVPTGPTSPAGQPSWSSGWQLPTLLQATGGGPGVARVVTYMVVEHVRLYHAKSKRWYFAKQIWIVTITYADGTVVSEVWRAWSYVVVDEAGNPVSAGGGKMEDAGFGPPDYQASPPRTAKPPDWPPQRR